MTRRLTVGGNTISGSVNSAENSRRPLQEFVRPMIGLPAWGVKQGHGSFLTFEFGEPRLEVHER